MNEIKIGQIFYYAEVIMYSAVGPDYYNIVELKVDTIYNIEKIDKNNNHIKYISVGFEPNKIYKNNAMININSVNLYKSIEELKEDMNKRYGFV